MDRPVSFRPGGVPDPDFWKSRRVLVTGHTGFKGAWLTCWLRDLGADVMGVALPCLPSQPALWDQLAMTGVRDLRADIVDDDDWWATVEQFAPEVVLHLAAQPLVSVGYAQPRRTYEVNVLGTVRVLDLVTRLGSVLAALVITTDKVYDPARPPPYAEGHPLGGHDPYAASKAAAELVVQGWPRSSSPVATARAGNVIGGGDWARDRLLPDLVRGWINGSSPSLRHPRAVRPWQHVLEPLRGYLLYVEALACGRQVPLALNFGPADQQSVSVLEVVTLAADEWRRHGLDLPSPAWSTTTTSSYAETSELSLDSTRAGTELGWMGLLTWQESVAMALEWYVGVHAGQPAAEALAHQLQAYQAVVQGRQ